MDTMGDIDGEDVMGMDTVGDDVVGVRSRLVRRRPVLHLPPALAGASTQGVSQPKEEMDFLNFTIVTAIPAGVLAAGFSTALEAFPQRPFRGERLLLTAQKTNAGVVTDVSAVTVINPAIYVGAVQIGASQGDTPFAAFAATAFGIRLAMPPA